MYLFPVFCNINAAADPDLVMRLYIIKETLEGVKDEHGKVVVHGIFASVPYCIQLLEGPYVETQAEVVAAFRPKNARREINL